VAGEPPHNVVVATWIGGDDVDALRNELAEELQSVDRPWRLRPALFDDHGLELFVDAYSSDDAAKTRSAVADACARVPGATVDGQWIFCVG
jgi:hypothetical protein